jgi:hypothetical protein
MKPGMLEREKEGRTRQRILREEEMDQTLSSHPMEATPLVTEAVLHRTLCKEKDSASVHGLDRMTQRIGCLDLPARESF